MYSSPLRTTLERSQRHCYGDGNPGESPLAVSPSIVLQVLSTCDLDPKDLATSFFLCEIPLFQFLIYSCQWYWMYPLQIVSEAAKFRYQSGNEFNWGGISLLILTVEVFQDQGHPLMRQIVEIFGGLWPYLKKIWLLHQYLSFAQFQL
jgi:hypothetical protein